MTPAVEINFDGLVGPTHNYAGLSYGNEASLKNRASVSNPRRAALQGLAKMKALADLGLPQGLLPPHDRPAFGFLRHLGFSGTDTEIAIRVAGEFPELFASASSASAMWVANAGTVASSADTLDERVHFTPANLTSKVHRAIESDQTSRTFREIFPPGAIFAHHPPLAGGDAFADEGAANHTRFCPEYGQGGFHFFVYGRSGPESGDQVPTRYPARQSREASEAVARLNQLEPDRIFLARQNPIAIDAGVFHNDVISVGNENVLLHHEDAFVDTAGVVGELKEHYRRICDDEMVAIEVPSSRVSLATAVRTYLFNSQLVTRPNGEGMLLIAPSECGEDAAVSEFIDELVASGPVRAVRYFDLRESMRNGGGPACLRFRMVLTDEQRAVVSPGVMINDATYPGLVAWVERHYRDHLSIDDLADPAFLLECRTALDELTHLMGIGSIYGFQ
ncbi:MAG: N-succinylarginine dihydrolase [Verrucomicrobia bacterium]|nr:MAG: N-succinylarginine dihydrolase [Verrucomicrobiota bacterium]